jgi:Zn-dependent M28 family amino/carboxypeptidase
MTQPAPKLWIALAGALALAACTAAPDGDAAAPPENLALTPAAATASEAITPEVLAAPIRALSSDEMEGRGPGGPGDEKARAYLAARLEELGYQPGAADGSWQQPFDIVGIDAKVPKQWTFAAPGGKGVALKVWDDFIAASGVQQPSAAIAGAEVVFVGFGIVAPEYDWDDYKGMDVKGKVLLMLNNDPDWDAALFEGERRLYYGRWTYKYEEAARQGAVAAIIVHTTPSAGYPWQVVQTSWSGPQFELPAGDEPRIQVAAWTTEEATRRLVGLVGKDLDDLVESARSRDFTPVPLGVTTSLSLANELQHTHTANVLGLLKGSDPKLAGQAVVFSAHHDHLGVGEPDASGDRIYNGAVDNAAGDSQVLAIARALKALPRAPRRSVLVAFVAAEEQGLLGSEYYAQHPTFPAGDLAADVNYDGGNIWGKTRDVTYIGLGKSSLDDVVERFAAQQGRTVKPDQFPDRGFFYRSDQFNFAKIGVPAIYLDNGTDFIGRPAGWGREQIEKWERERYHQPSDEMTDDWVFDGMVEDSRLGFYCGLSIAEEPQLPTWNPGDEFEAARTQALAAQAGGEGGDAP